MSLPTANTFLGLPAAIRQQIYYDAGVIRHICLALVPKHHRNHLTKLQRRRVSTLVLTGVTYNLLQVCKEVNQEVGTMICAHNTLIVAHDEIDYGLTVLLGLSHQQCAALGNVSVHLVLKASANSWLPVERPLPNESLSEARIALWVAAARHILANSHQNISLQIFCHTGASSNSISVLQPLVDFPGRLKRCEIQLDCKIGANHVQTQELAYETACIAEGLDPSLRSGPFRFFDLPFEIRQYILKFTDLVTPFNEIAWSASRGFRSSYMLKRCPGEEHCGKIRRLYHEAVQVLYSCNRVVIVPSGNFKTAITPISRRFDISTFITRHTWPEVLQHLRDIECVFPAIDPLYANISREPHFFDFRFALDHLASKVDLEKLTISVYLTMLSSELLDDDEWFHRQLKFKDTLPTLHAHAEILKPFSTMRGIKGFFVNLEWPSRFGYYDSPEASRRMFGLYKREIEVHNQELWLEKMVMGHQYDPNLSGKLTRWPSAWLHRMTRREQCSLSYVQSVLEYWYGPKP
ncbi:hypothetical protein F5Y01DRAFT_322520 [Xylaria sp. FL0043]|nr:hypothetical protein F5Y01DRAFT_322520 [Xylaria sp. FL0043]